MYGFFQKIQNPSENVILVLFFSFENKPWGSTWSAAWGHNRVLPGFKIECIHTKSVSVWMHLILTPGALYFDPRLKKLKKAINHIFKRDLDFLKKNIHLIIFLRFYGKKFFFKLGNSFKQQNCQTIYYSGCTFLHLLGLH